jgi:DNA polymerase I-like protein with 3'-5' exonuclease and polymerase domains
MALASIILEKNIHKKGLDSLKVGDVHDEYLYDVHPDDAEEHRRLSLEALKESGEALNLNIPITGNSLIGRSWAVVH